MPKPILNAVKQTAVKQNDILSAAGRQEQRGQQKQTDKMKLDRLLRRRRSKEYMDALHSLDAGGHVHNQDKVNEILHTIQNEFPEVELSEMLLGYVSICYLGKPYEVHVLDVTGRIIEHYQAGQMLPDGLEKARGIAMRGGYEFIEVYIDCCRAVSANGAVSVIPC